MKTILCFGDSNTYGYSPLDGTRFPADVRWPGRLRILLGDDYSVVEEGCNGRTTVIIDEEEPWKCGESYLRACLNSHKPVDLLIIMLGSNDMKKQYHAAARDIASGAEKLAEIARTFLEIKQDRAPEILLISPPLIRKGISASPFGHSFSEEAVKVSEELAALYEEAAKRQECHYLDAAGIVVPSREDHLHLTAGEHEKLAGAIAGTVREIFAPKQTQEDQEAGRE